MKLKIILLILFTITINAQWTNLTNQATSSTITSNGYVWDKGTAQAYIGGAYTSGQYRIGVLSAWHSYPDTTNVVNGDTVWLRTTTAGEGTYKFVNLQNKSSSDTTWVGLWTVSTTPNATPNVWYVNANAGDSANGTSWTNAWTHFRESTGGVDWSSIEGGDTIYISGGSDSTLYFNDDAYSNRFVAVDELGYIPQIIIRPSWEANHNGRVMFTPGTSTNYVMLLEKIHGVRFENLEVFMLDDMIAGGGAFYGNDITVYNWYFRMGQGGGGALKIDGNNAIYDSCYFEREENEYLLDTDMFGHNNNVEIYSHQTTGSMIIKNSTFVYRNGYTAHQCSGAGNVTVTDTSLTDTGLNMPTNYYYHEFTNYTMQALVLVVDDTSIVPNQSKFLRVTSNNNTTLFGTWEDVNENPCAKPPSGVCYDIPGSHRDALQISEIGRTEFVGDSSTTIVVANNLIIDLAARGTGWNKMIYSYSPWVPYQFFCYNNIIVSRKTISSNRNIGIETPNIYPYNQGVCWNSDLYLVNNTIITKGGGNLDNKFLTSYNLDTSRVNNNLIVMDSVMSFDGIYNLDGADGWPLSHKLIDYNYYAIEDYETVWAFDNANTRTLAVWQAAPYNQDNNSYFHSNNDVIFTNKYGLNFEDYYITAGRDSAIDLSYIQAMLPEGAPPITKDALGNDRESGAWDIGALEFQGTASADTNGTVSFTSVTNAELNSYHIAYGVVSGLDSTSHLWTVTSDSFKVGALSSFNLTMQEVENGDTIYIPNSASNLYSTANVNYIVLSGASHGFSVTTKASPPITTGGFVKGSNLRYWFANDGILIKVKP